MNDWPIRRRRRLPAAWVLPLLLASSSCATLSDRAQPLVPTRYQVRSGPFILLSNFPMTDNPPAIRCLLALERDLRLHLDYRAPAGDDPVEIYVLDGPGAFAHFLQFYYPELPPRRAFFLAQGRTRVVYTYASPRLEEDLRHEATHALLHGSYGTLPLWLDEGLAEYFETDLAQPDAQRARIEHIATDLRDGWSPDLRRLESLADIRQMTPRDYREAWAWVHLLLNGAQQEIPVLSSYLDDLNHKPERIELSARLAQTGALNDQLLAHLEKLKSRTLARGPGVGDPSVRFQDPTVKPPVATPPPRGHLRRIRRWFGL